MRSLHLTGAPNTRDLGGLSAADGRRVLPGKLIRSGALWQLTEADKAKLASVPVTTVVDFRTKKEISEKPDLPIPGAQWTHCPILPQLTGVTRQLGDDGVPAYFRMAIDMGMDAENWMSGLYLPLVESEYSQTHYRAFLRMLLSQGDGALLYHCTVGKDRVGVGTMLILSALGVSRETILEDYLLTNDYTEEARETVCAEIRQYSDDPATQFAMRAFESVRPRYLETAFSSIDRHFGSTERYLAEVLDFGPDAQSMLRGKFLEKG